MLPSKGYFKQLNCPFFDSGLCERPFCHFRHTKRETDINGEGIENPEILQQLVSEAVKKVLQGKDGSSSDVESTATTGTYISKVVREHQSTEIGVQVAGKVTYNPTPIAELNKLLPSDELHPQVSQTKEQSSRRHIPVPYTPYRPSRPQIRASGVVSGTDAKIQYLPGSVAANTPVPYNPIPNSGADVPDPNGRLSSNSSYIPTNIGSIGTISKENCYTPSGDYSSGVTYNPGTVAPPNYSTSGYYPTSSYSSARPGGESPCYSSALHYEPTPLLKTVYPQFSSDEEDEPINKKPKLYDLADLEDLDQEFEILDQILEDENDRSIKPVVKSSQPQEKTKDSKDVKIKDSSDDRTKRRDSKSESKTKPSKDSSSKTDDLKSCDLKIKSKSSSTSKTKSEETSSKSNKSKSDSSKRESSNSRKTHSSSNKDVSKDKHSSSDKSKSSKSSSSKHSSKSTERDKSKDSSKSSNSKSRSESKNRSPDKKSKDEKSSSKSRLDKNEKTDKSKKSDSHKSERRERSERSGKNEKSEKSEKKDKSDRKSGSHSRSKNSDENLSKPKESSEDNDLSILSDSEMIEVYSDSEEERIRTEECLKIFEEYVPSVKETVNPQVANKQDNSGDESGQLGKKRVAHATNQTIYRSSVPALPNHKVKAVQQMSDRYAKVKEFHQSRAMKLPSSDVQMPHPRLMSPPIREEPLSSKSSVGGSNSSKVRIAHVPNVSTLLTAKKALVVKPPPPEVAKVTAVQTVSKGTSRVAHMPNDKFADRPGVLEPLAGKIPANVRSRYLNYMIDACLNIYLTVEDAYERAQQEELATSKKCTAIPTYKSSAVLAVGRLKKELKDAQGVKKSGNNLTSHEKILAGKLGEKASWSILSRNKKECEYIHELQGSKFYENISRWIMSEQELQDNGFPRPHPENKSKGAAKIYTKNTRQKPQKGYIRWCCRCRKEYTVDKKGVAIKTEECIYHPNNKYKVRGEVKYQCCSQDTSSDGCLSASGHVYEYIDHDNLRGYVRTLSKEDLSDEADYGVFALDCEMCYTTNGLDLTRVTVIDPSLKVVYESLVKPIHPIIDYNTRYSGLTEENMSGVTTSLIEVQATFLHMFSNKTILVGHSLESDFKALKLVHDTVVDTSVLFPHKMGPPYKRALRNLSSEHLRKIIQNSVDGHDSAEDATVCMELLIWKLKEELKLR